MIVFRRRLLYWLIREYIKKWGKTIVLSFVIGLFVFFILLTSLRYLLPKVPVGRNESIGVVGSFRVESLPGYILEDVSKGLTSVSQDGKPLPSLARQWKIENDGKKYTFFLRSDIFFTDGTQVTSDTISYRFPNVDIKVEKPNKNTIVFILKDPYSPFLISVSRPIFKNGFIGTGPYVVKDIKVNGDFVQTLILSLKDNPYKIRTYQFYSSYDALKMAYVLGELSKARALSDTTYKNIPFEKSPNTRVEKTTNYDYLVTIFYNTQDSVLSDKRLRSALTYALPDTFSEGMRTSSPISPRSWAYDDSFAISQDIEQAKILLSASATGSSSAGLKLEIKTFPKYKHVAEEIVKAWKEIGVKANVTTTDTVPLKYQVFLGNFFLPKDPDQYTFWHKAQINNITHYDNQRIDKLLEDGRTKTDIDVRKKIYSDFQKYLLADSPASFLFFPYEYELTRK